MRFHWLFVLLLMILFPILGSASQGESGPFSFQKCISVLTKIFKPKHIALENYGPKFMAPPVPLKLAELAIVATLRSVQKRVDRPLVSFRYQRKNLLTESVRFDVAFGYINSVEVAPDGYTYIHLQGADGENRIRVCDVLSSVPIQIQTISHFDYGSNVIGEAIERLNIAKQNGSGVAIGGARAILGRIKTVSKNEFGILRITLENDFGKMERLSNVDPVLLETIQIYPIEMAPLSQKAKNLLSIFEIAHQNGQQIRYVQHGKRPYVITASVGTIKTSVHGTVLIRLDSDHFSHYVDLSDADVLLDGNVTVLK